MCDEERWAWDVELENCMVWQWERFRDDLLSGMILFISSQEIQW
jgi:hypothetical protein